MRPGPLAATIAIASLPSPAFALATVRADRPRILLSNGSGFGTSKATYLQRCTTDPYYQASCQGALSSPNGGWPAINFAAAYLVNGDPNACGSAYAELQTLTANLGPIGQP